MRSKIIQAVLVLISLFISGVLLDVLLRDTLNIERNLYWAIVVLTGYVVRMFHEKIE